MYLYQAPIKCLKIYFLCLLSILVARKCFAASLAGRDNVFELELDNKYNIPINRNIQNTLKKIYRNGIHVCYEDNSIFFNNTCVRLGSNNVDFCQDNEILVFQKPQNIQIEGKIYLKIYCEALKCDKTLIWWSFFKKCVDYSHVNEICGENAQPATDVFGDTICDCILLYGKLNETGKCYKYYAKGPCEDTQVFVHNSLTSYGKCEADLCLKENEEVQKSRMIKSTSTNGNLRKTFAPLNGNGKCMELSGSTTECGFPQVFDIDFTTLLPTCVPLPAMAASGAIGGLRCHGNKESCDQRIDFLMSPHDKLKQSQKEDGFD